MFYLEILETFEEKFLPLLRNMKLGIKYFLSASFLIVWYESWSWRSIFSFIRYLSKNFSINFLKIIPQTWIFGDECVASLSEIDNICSSMGFLFLSRFPILETFTRYFWVDITIVPHFIGGIHLLMLWFCCVFLLLIWFLSFFFCLLFVLLWLFKLMIM